MCSLIEFLGDVEQERSVLLLREMFRHNLRTNIFEQSLKGITCLLCYNTAVRHSLRDHSEYGFNAPLSPRIPTVAVCHSSPHNLCSSDAIFVDNLREG